MNPRIQELAKQAGLDDADFPIENWDNVPLAKFTELIVRECAKVCNDIDAEYEGEDVLANWCASEIKKHFGVEE